MAGYGTATQELADKLSATGLDATADPRSLNLPGVWIQPTGFDHDRLSVGAYTATWTLHAVVPDNGPIESLDALTELDALLRDALPALGAASIVGVQLPNHSAEPLPALQYTIDMEVS